MLTIGYCITAFTIIVLFLKNIDKKQTRYAVLLLTVWFTRFLLFYLEDNLDLLKYPFLIVLDQNLFFLDGVILYWYVASYDDRLKLKNQLLSLIPFILSILHTTFIYLSFSTEGLVNAHNQIIETLSEGTYKISLSSALNIIIMVAINFYFFIKSSKLLKEYKILLSNNYSTISDLQVNWLIKLVRVWFALFYIPFVLYFIDGISSIFPISYLEIIAESGMVITAVFFCANVMIQRYPQTTLEKTPNSSSKNKELIHSPKYKQKFLAISEFMQNNKLYLDVNLTLESLSRDMDMKPVEVSRAINSQNGTNFHEFVNEYRINLVKLELVSSKEQIIIIAYNNGFNSKSTFNSVFKKFTGITPSQFRKKNQSNVY